VLHIGSEPVFGYCLQSRLGAGAFGEVWEATTPDGGRVALKFIDSRKKESSLLRSEIRLQRALTEGGHPNVVRLLGVYASSYYLVLSLELADGNLDELRHMYREVTGRNIAPDHLLELLGQVAEGLDFMARLKLPGFNQASAGLQHCDIKPSNLLLKGDCVKIADFGLCAAMGEQMHKHGCRGTPPFAAPELFRGHASATTDQFSLAVTYCDLVAGDRILTPPGHGGDGSAVHVDLDKVRARERPVLERALSPDPTRRWPSCETFIDALREVALPGMPEKEYRRRAPRPGLARPSSPA
jgi:serine/threonine protein kinase